MENANLRPYQDLVNCHCHPQNKMLPDGDNTYSCSHCGWRILIVLQTPPVGWYQYDENEDTSRFPRCLDCGVQMRMTGAVHLPEGERFFKVIVFACGPNDKHGRRLLNAYPVEISREEYDGFGPSREEFLSQFIEDILLDDSEELSSPFRIIERSAHQETAEIDIEGMADEERQTLARMLRLLEIRGLVHEVHFKRNSVSFTVDEDLRNAIAEGKAMRSASANITV